MTVCVSDSRNTSYDGKLKTTNGWYRAEAYNIGFMNANPTGLSGTTAKTQSITFANAGNVCGVVLAFNPQGTTWSAQRGITVSIKNGATVVATVTYTNAQLVAYTDNTALMYAKSWIIPFIFPTPAAVTAGAYTLEIVQTSTGTANWSYYTSDGTNLSYVVWCDNKVTATSGSDQLIINDPISIDGAFTTKAMLGTGDSSYGTSVIITRSMTPATATVAKLTWPSAPASAYTFTLDGVMVMGTHSGFQAGTSATRIPYAQAMDFYIPSPTAGTTVGPRTLQYGNYNLGNASFMVYCAPPTTTIERALASQAASGQKNIVLTTSPTDWVVGDRLLLPQTIYSNAVDTQYYTITAISGTTVTVDKNLVYPRQSGGPVINIERSGGKIRTGGTYTTSTFLSPDNFTISGCEINQFYMSMKIQSGQWCDDYQNYMSQYSIDNNFFVTFNNGQNVVNDIEVPSKGIYVYKNYSLGAMLIGSQSYTAQGALGIGALSGAMIQDSNVTSSSTYGSAAYVRGTNPIFTNNRMYQSIGNVVQPFMSLGDGNFPAVNPTINNNLWWGASSPWGVFNIIYTAGTTATYQNNSWQNCGYPFVFFTGITLNVKGKNNKFGNVVANSANITINGSPFINWFEDTPLGTLAFDPTAQKLAIDGSYFKIANYNNTANDDRDILKNGNFQRTGYGLSDTTVHTLGTTFGAASAGKFALRMAPNSGTNILSLSQNVPTGNIQGKTMTIGVWCEILNAAFYAGTYVLPTLTVTYDNGSTASATAATAAGVGQFLYVAIAPLTTYGQITVTISCATNATGSNAYVYWDDFSIPFPPGVTVDNSGMDSWAEGLPVFPATSNNPLPGSIWDEQVSGHQGAGSFGAQDKQSNILIKNLPAVLG